MEVWNKMMFLFKHMIFSGARFFFSGGVFLWDCYQNLYKWQHTRRHINIYILNIKSSDLVQDLFWGLKVIPVVFPFRTQSPRRTTRLNIQVSRRMYPCTVWFFSSHQHQRGFQRAFASWKIWQFYQQKWKKNKRERQYHSTYQLAQEKMRGVVWHLTKKG